MCMEYKMQKKRKGEILADTEGSNADNEKDL